MLLFVFFFKQKTAYEMRISDWSSDVCSSDLTELAEQREAGVLQILGVDRGQPIEHRWIVRQGIRRVDRPVARCRAVAFRALRVDPRLKGETAEHEVEALAADRKRVV